MAERVSWVESRRASRVSDTGLTPVVVPDAPTIDIVFVHGFTGHPEKTWSMTTKANPAPRSDLGSRPPKLRKVFKLGFSSSRAVEEEKSVVYWPRDLVPQVLPNARVLTYGYDTHIRHLAVGPTSQNSLYNHAGDFLTELETHRRGDPSRPLIFIAHSLGGLIVKDMLRQSRGHMNHNPHRRVFMATVGVIFFGTPHEGAGPLGVLHQTIALLAKGIGFRVNEKIVEALSPSTDQQIFLKDEFNSMVNERDWLIYSFQEQYPLAVLGKKVVEDDSSCIRHSSAETVQHIGSTHKDMCRFSGPESKEFHKVAAALERISGAASTAASHSPRANQGIRTVEEPYQSTTTTSEAQRVDTRHGELLDSLSFANIHARHSAIQRAHSSTCRWLLGLPEYMSWATAPIGCPKNFLWIKGKLGTGKSTLMKFALSQAKAKEQIRDALVIHFFFHARGEVLENSTLGLYRSLLYQLLQSAPDLRSVFDTEPGIQGKADYHAWSLNQLEALFTSAVKMLPKGSLLVCYIDALDECNEDEVRAMISHFTDLFDEVAPFGVHVRLLLSSRHYPYITIDRGLTFMLECQHSHKKDIKKYIAAKLLIGESSAAREIKQKVLEKASSVFLWAKLVVDILNKEYDRGNVRRLRERLDEIPTGLSGLFKDLLTRDKENLEELWLCIRWVAFAKRPLRIKELYFAIAAGLENSLSKPACADTAEILEQDIERYLLARSKGLTEVVGDTRTVQFIHESVRDFLIRDDGFAMLWPHLEEDFPSKSHEILRKCCEVQLFPTSGVLDPLQDEGQMGILGDYFKREEYYNEHPFLQYAILHVFYHADEAERLGRTQQEFIESFDREQWIRLRNGVGGLALLTQLRYTMDASFTYIFADMDCPSLLERQPDLNSHYLTPTKERLRYPLHAALARSHDACSRVLLTSLLGPNKGTWGFPPQQLDTYSPRYEIDFWTSPTSPSLSELLNQEDEILLYALIGYKVRHNLLTNSESKELFCAASSYPNRRFFPNLLHYGLRWPNQRDMNSAIVGYAIYHGFQNITEMIFKEEPEITCLSTENSEYGEFLQDLVDPSAGWDWELVSLCAIRGRRSAVALHLLSSKVTLQINPQGGLCGPAAQALVEAVKFNLPDVVRYLTQQENSPESGVIGWDTKPMWTLLKSELFGVDRSNMLDILLDGKEHIFHTSCAFDFARLDILMDAKAREFHASRAFEVGNIQHWVAKDSQHEEDIKVIVPRVADPNREDTDIMTYWGIAIHYQNPVAVRGLLKSGQVNPNLPLRYPDMPPLHGLLSSREMQVLPNKLRILSLLVDSPLVDVNLLHKGRTALETVLLGGRCEYAIILLRSGRLTNIFSIVPRIGCESLLGMFLPSRRRGRLDLVAWLTTVKAILVDPTYQSEAPSDVAIAAIEAREIIRSSKDRSHIKECRKILAVFDEYLEKVGYEERKDGTMKQKLKDPGRE